MTDAVTPCIHNKPFHHMTDQELREEHAYWDERIRSATSWGGSVAAANEFRSTIARILSVRESEKANEQEKN